MTYNLFVSHIYPHLKISKNKVDFLRPDISIVSLLEYPNCPQAIQCCSVLCGMPFWAELLLDTLFLLISCSSHWKRITEKTELIPLLKIRGYLYDIPPHLTPKMEMKGQLAGGGLPVSFKFLIKLLILLMLFILILHLFVFMTWCLMQYLSFYVSCNISLSTLKGTYK